MPLDIDDDEHVAKLLAQDAKKTTKTYSLVGLDAFNPKRLRAGAPKPNTNFLRQIIRQTDSHNAALLAKEAEESSSRLRQMNRAIVGPLPPPPEPTLRSRGRGAYKGNSMGIESRFSTNYDPSVDVKPDLDAEDDWGEALEVMRDRERWKQQGADRLRAAGFKDEQVKTWEKGGDPMEEDVVWTKKGQGREWDRGKVVDDDGDVALEAQWGRLK
ncbi:hypothetical protein N0V87_005584 [Didymella glomerata]|uniref:Uncharacterized protein n=1 Tax=Didymella glomerata TaxID=749621 RepID=A0A9W9BYT5_9PLEO|nr:hypothetical protein N0V87_005584 [Didymella glomerata]